MTIIEREPDLSIVSGAFWGRNPHAELAWIRRHDPVYFDAAAGVWGISKYEHIKEIESDPVTFSNAGGIRPETGPIPMMIDMDDPEHRMRRKLVSKGFTPNRVRRAGTGDPRARPRPDRRDLRAGRVRLRVGPRGAGSR